MIDSMLQDSIDTTLDDRQARTIMPPTPASSFSLWNTVKAPSKGVGAGILESGGFASDMLGAFGQVQAGYGSQADPTLIFDSKEAERREQQGAAARANINTGAAFSTDLGSSMRQSARDLVPDPVTSNVVENLLFQLPRFATKAVGYSMMGGPAVGAVLTGTDEALTEADRLKAEGVDISTRSGVGLVAGVASGLGVAMPVAGKTAVQTAVLVAAGGPAAFAVQQALSRSILQNADYTKISDQYNPFDPVGLAVSTLVPAGFGYLHMRGATQASSRVAAADPAQARALVQMGMSERQALPYNDPRLDAYAIMAAQRVGVPPEILLAAKNAGEKSSSSAATSPVGAKGIMQFMDRTWAQYGKGDVRDPVAAIDGAAAYFADLGKRYGGNWRAALAEYNGGIKNARAVLDTGNAVSAETIRYLKRTDDYMRDMGGRAASAADPDAVNAARVAQVRDVVESWNLKDPADIAAAQDHLGAVVRAIDQMGSGQRVDVSDLASWQATDGVRVADEMLGRMEAARADLLPEVGNISEPGAVRDLREQIEQLRQQAPQTGESAIKARAKEIQVETQQSYKQALSAARREITARSAETEQRIAALEQQVETNRRAENSRQQLDALDRQIAELRDTRDQISGGQPVPREAAVAARQTFEPQARQRPAAEPSAEPARIAAPAVLDGVAPTPEAKSPTADETGSVSIDAAAPVAQGLPGSERIDAQAADLARLSPDMMIQLDGMDAPARLADVLATVKQEAARDAADAPLLQVAAECFLMNS